MHDTIDQSGPDGPFDAWHRLAVDTIDTVFASAEVITLRALQVQSGGPLPDVKQASEAELMVREKLEAAGEAASRATHHVVTVGLSFSKQSTAQWMRHTETMMGLAAWIDPGQVHTVLSDIVHQVLLESARSTQRWSDATAQIAHTALVPIQQRVIANVRRLGAEPR